MRLFVASLVSSLSVDATPIGQIGDIGGVARGGQQLLTVVDRRRADGNASVGHDDSLLEASAARLFATGFGARRRCRELIAAFVCDVASLDISDGRAVKRIRSTNDIAPWSDGFDDLLLLALNDQRNLGFVDLVDGIAVDDRRAAFVGQSIQHDIPVRTQLAGASVRVLERGAGAGIAVDLHVDRMGHWADLAIAIAAHEAHPLVGRRAARQRRQNRHSFQHDSSLCFFLRKIHATPRVNRQLDVAEVA